MKFLLLLLLVNICQAKDYPWFDTTDGRKLPLTPYERQYFSRHFTKNVLKQIVLEMNKQVWGRGFTWLGEQKDWFHGHVLYPVKNYNLGDPPVDRVEPNTKAISILWHTQEGANDGEIPYLDKLGRNWVQSISNPVNIVNGCRLRKRIDDTGSCGNGAFTLFPRDLVVDGHHVDEDEKNDLQEINFGRVDCRLVSESPGNNLIKVSLNGEDYCLLFASYHCASFVFKENCQYE